MALSGNSVTTFVQMPAVINVIKIRVTVFVKRVSGESFVISHVLTCARTISVILNQETVLIVIREIMDNFARLTACKVVVTFATHLQEPVHANRSIFWLIVHNHVRKTALIAAALKKMELV